MADRVWTLRSGEEVATWEPSAAGYTPPTNRQRIDHAITIPDNETDVVSFLDGGSSGTPIFDLTSPTHPVVVAAGVYAITVSVAPNAESVSSDTGLALVNVVLDDNAGLAINAYGQIVIEPNGHDMGCTIAETKFLAAGEGFTIEISNLAPTPNLYLVNVMAQRVS